jgi:catalase
MDGFGVHTFRLVTDDGKSKLIKWHWKTLQGKASLVWEEAQVLAGKNADAHRQDLFESIDAGRYPEWELGVQIMDEEDRLRFGFDLLDPTKVVPEELVPVTPLGKMQLNRNPRNYFAETEQVMYQPAHIVRGVDFTDDPLLQGRLYSYLDTQLNRNNGPNFEQIPINQPHVPVHNNNRDGHQQMFIPLNPVAYSPNSLNPSANKQANQTSGRGFFTAPGRTVSGKLQRTKSKTFADVWSQPRMFFNSLVPAEQQFLVNAMRFELSHLKSSVVKDNVIIQLNRVSHDLAQRVARAIGLKAPKAAGMYYNDNSTAYVSILNGTLARLDGLKVGVLTSSTQMNGTAISVSMLRTHLAEANVDVITVGEYLADGINQTYSAADATGFDAVVVVALPATNASSTLFPAGRPQEIVTNAYKWGKPIALLAATKGMVDSGPGVYEDDADMETLSEKLQSGLKTFKFADRFVLD